MAFRHPSYEIAISDFEKERVGLYSGTKVSPGEWGLPDLEGVMFLRRLASSHAKHVPVLKKGLSVTNERCIDLLSNQVVTQLKVNAGLLIDEQVQIILAVR